MGTRVTWQTSALPLISTGSRFDDVKPYEGAAETPVVYSAAMDTFKIVNQQELLCLTVFTIADVCVKYNHIRME